jgi:protein-disulfide isomerase
MDNNKLQQILVWVLIVIGLAAIVLGMVGVVSQKSKLGTLINPINSSDWIRGDKNAKVQLVEYSDFQCPACGYFYGLTKNLEKDFPKDLVIVYRNFPLEQVHKYARLAAQSAIAAGIQGKFWEMHDILFEKQAEWSVSSDARINFIAYAKILGLNVNKFKIDIDSKEVSDKIQGDLTDGNNQSIQGTPTFFLNGKQIANPQNYDEFKKLIEEGLQNTK